ncbi:MAG TPA: response regulator [Gaiellaceae bacterium]|nr:response regulator [Gaiellaceae bacterium]
MSFQRASGSRATPDQSSRTVLVVEDDAGLRAYLATTLEAQGYSVIAAGSGEEGLKALGTQTAMLAVLDIVLPGMDGFAVAEHLDENVPVIVVTGDPLKAKMRAFGRTPPLTILAKPVTPEQFEAALQAVL